MGARAENNTKDGLWLLPFSYVVSCCGTSIPCRVSPCLSVATVAPFNSIATLCPVLIHWLSSLEGKVARYSLRLSSSASSDLHNSKIDALLESFISRGYAETRIVPRSSKVQFYRIHADLLLYFGDTLPFIH